jgi:hypothetical protein
VNPSRDMSACVLDYRNLGDQRTLGFREKGGKDREIPVATKPFYDDEDVKADPVYAQVVGGFLNGEIQHYLASFTPKRQYDLLSGICPALQQQSPAWKCKIPRNQTDSALVGWGMQAGKLALFYSCSVSSPPSLCASALRNVWPGRQQPELLKGFPPRGLDSEAFISGLPPIRRRCRVGFSVS